MLAFLSAKFLAHKIAIHRLEFRDAVEDIAPKVVVVPLARDTPVLVESQHGSPVDGGVGIFLEPHGHHPLHEDRAAFLGDGVNVHGQLFAALCKALAEGDELLYALDALDGVLEDDIWAVIGIDVGPVGLSAGVIRL